jgi:hypothetical protein
MSISGFNNVAAQTTLSTIAKDLILIHVNGSELELGVWVDVDTVFDRDGAQAD